MTIGILIVVAVLIAGGVYLSMGYQNNVSAPYSSAAGTATTSTAVRFSDSRYASTAYLISTTSTYDAATQKALMGFQVKKQTLSDGSLQIDLIALKGEYQTQKYTVKPGEKLYFVEGTFADDSASEDHSPMDDHAILVSADGFIQ